MLDTNHLTELGYETKAGARLSGKLDKSGLAAVTTIVCVEEQLRGWLARIAKLKDVHEQIQAYAELGERVNFLAALTLLPMGPRGCGPFQAPAQTARPTRHHGFKNRPHHPCA